MAFFDWGNVPVNSTGSGTVSNPTSTALVAQIDSTQLAAIETAGGIVRVTWIVGVSSTGPIFLLEQCLSTGLGATAVRQSIPVQVSPAVGAQFVTTHRLEVGDRLRARLDSTMTGVATAFIQAEHMT